MAIKKLFLKLIKEQFVHVSLSIKEYIMITFGLLLYALAWKLLLLPHHIVGGGVTGIGALVYFGTGVPISVTYFIINAILLAVAIKTIGLNFSIRTIFGVVMLTFFFAVLPEVPIGTLVAETDNFLACVIGGIMCGTGIAIVFINNGSSGGTDIIAKVVNKYKNVTLGRMLLYCDVVIIGSSYLLPEGNLEKMVYGLCLMVVATYTVDVVINGVRQSVQFLIFSEKYEEIATAISVEVHRGVTLLEGTGWYSKKPVKVITVLARKNESVKIFHLVKEIDPNAFVSQSSAIGVYGEGFDVIKSK